jgi:hypothetical protein
MARFPTDDHVHDLFDRLRRHARPTKPGDSDRLVTLHELEHRTIAAIRRARTPAPAIDGYPASLGGDGRGGAELTSVEAAAEVLAFGRGEERDVVSDLAEDAYGYLEQAVQSIGALSGVLDRLDRLSTATPRATLGGAGTCLGCSEDVSGAADDRLRRGLCPACYKAWRRMECPPIDEFKRLRKGAA